MDYLDGAVLFRLDPNASADRLDIQVGGSSCGLSYTAGCISPVSVPAVRALSGEVEDFNGAVIPDARVSVLSHDGGAEMLRVATNQQGKFEIKNLPNGAYMVRITRPAFSRFITDLSIDRTRTAGELNVKLGLLGGCTNTAKFHLGH